MKLNLILNNQILKEEKVIKFLGIRFDEFCRFDHQINYIKSVVSDRLNLLKILSHRSWNLSLANRKQLYCSLVRSVVEYSSFLLPIISNKLLNLVKTIQNNALRIILNKKRTDKISIIELHELVDIETIDARLQKLRVEYLYKALSSNNPLITEIVNDYINYSGGRILKFRSLLDKANVRIMISSLKVRGQQGYKNEAKTKLSFFLFALKLLSGRLPCIIIIFFRYFFFSLLFFFFLFHFFFSLYQTFYIIYFIIIKINYLDITLDIELIFIKSILNK